jgi:integrase
MAIDVHDFPTRFKGAMRAIDNDSRISDRNKQLIAQYKHEMLARGLTLARVVRKLYDLKGICIRWLPDAKDLDSLDIQDIKEIVAQIETSNHAESTKAGFKVTLKAFVTWIRGHETAPPELSWIKVGIKRSKAKLPEDLLTEEEVQRLINAEPHLRQRALISVLYESGCRIGELLSLRLKNVSFDEHGALLLVHGKTGYRRVRVIASMPYLLEWLNRHPKRDDPEAVLWSRLGTAAPASYPAIRKMLSQAAKRAGVKKRVNPHNFRHSRATALARHLTEAQMKEYLGWVQGSDMAAVYVHLSGRDVDGALLKMYGIQTDEATNGTRLLSKRCSRCQELHGFADVLCKRCGNSLRDPAETVTAQVRRNEADAILDTLLSDPTFKELLVQRLRATVRSAQLA